MTRIIALYWWPNGIFVPPRVPIMEAIKDRRSWPAVERLIAAWKQKP